MAKTKTQTQALDPITQNELTFVEGQASAITDFFRGALAYLTRSRELDVRAGETLEAVKALEVPKTGEDDESLQRTLKTIAADKKETEAHHEPFAGAFHRVHKRLVALRKSTTDKLETASTLGNQMHNDFVAAERRRAQAEADRLQRIADEQARKDRAAELAELERQRLAAEESSPDLSERERVFINMQVQMLNTPYEAAKRAGYKDPEEMSARLMASSKILAAITAAEEAKALTEQAAAVKAAPLEARVVQVKPDIRKPAGTVSRTRWHMEYDDEQAFIDAVFAGEIGIPRDVLCIDRVRMNQYATDNKSMLKWPGVRAVSDTRTS